MTVEAFFGYFLEELEGNPALWEYYKFLKDPKMLGFRRAYFCQRLQYILDHIGSREQKIWDCGCGYGTTALFLALNGYTVYGTTLEFYFEQIEKRKAFWSQYGSVDLFTCSYSNLYESAVKEVYDTIIVQDTLHHLEPLKEGLAILNQSLRKGGKLVIVEENGSNLVQRLKLWRLRGFNKKVRYFDKRLQKEVVFADEQIKGLGLWKRLLYNAGFKVVSDSVEYIRLLPPAFYGGRDDRQVVVREQRLARGPRLLREFFYFGINFIAHK